MAAYLPSRRNPVSLTTMRRGFFFSRTVSGSRPSFSSTPGRKGSIRTSVLGIRERKVARDAGDLRSRAMEDLWFVRRSLLAEGLGRSMRRTLAPQFARRTPQKGPGGILDGLLGERLSSSVYLELNLRARGLSVLRVEGWQSSWVPALGSVLDGGRWRAP